MSAVKFLESVSWEEQTSLVGGQLEDLHLSWGQLILGLHGLGQAS